HPETLLVPIQIGEEDNPRLVGVGGGLEDVARQRNRGLERRAVPRHVPPVQRLQGRRRRGGDRVEDAQQRVAVHAVLAKYQPVVVEIVPRVHAHALRHTRAHLDLQVRVEQRDLDPVHLDRKSTRLNSSHVAISYAVFCLKKKKRILRYNTLRRSSSHNTFGGTT